MLTASALTTCSACVLTAPGSSSPAVAPPTASWALLGQWSIQTVYHKISHRPVWWGYFLDSGFLFPSGSSLCQIDKKLVSTLILQGELINGHTEEFPYLILVCLWRMAVLQFLIQDSTQGCVGIHCVLLLKCPAELVCSRFWLLNVY